MRKMSFYCIGVLWTAFTAGAAEWYVAKTGSDANAGTAAAPKLTIQSAIDSAPSDAVIHVARGTYGPITSQGTKGLTIVADEGPFVTFIDGGNTRRCAHLRISGKAEYRGNDTIVGFTLKNGYSDDYGGGVYFGQVSRCIVRDCYARYGGGVSGSMVDNSLVFDNAAGAEGSQVYNSTVYNLTVVGREGDTRNACTYNVLYNCLVFGDVTDGQYGSHTNSLVLSRDDLDEYLNSDFIPYSDCAAIVGAGHTAHVLASQENDLVGNPRKTGGKVSFGCYETSVTRPSGFAYVDASRPDDTGDGLTPETACRTIGAALAVAKDGWTIRVAPGVYANGIVRYAEGEDDPTVSIVATEGPQRTILRAAQYHAVAELLPGDRLSGFTLTGGSLGGISHGTAERCIISNNCGTAVCGAEAVNCLIVGNTAYGDNRYESAVISDSVLRNCTVTENLSEYKDWADGVCGMVDSTAYNSIVFGNRVGDSDSTTDWTLSEEDCHDCCLTDPFFFNPALGDWRLTCVSPAAAAGNPIWTSRWNSGTDLEGNPRLDDSGLLDAGCYQGSVWVPRVTVVTDGPGLASAGRPYVHVGGTVTVTATETTRALIGFYVGETLVSSTSPCVIPNVQTDLTVRVQFCRSIVLKPGDSIQAAIDAAWDGDTIELAAGVYEPFDATGRELTIRGAGYGVTFIDGGETNRCATLGTKNSSLTTAVERVTLINGWASDGGGAYGGLLRDVVVSDCRATYSGGGVYGTDCRHVLIVNCSSESGGGAFGARLADSTIACTYAPTGDAAYKSAATRSILAGKVASTQTTDTYVGTESSVCFISIEDDDWRIAHISPAVGKGFYPDGVRVSFISTAVSGHGTAYASRTYTTTDYTVSFTASAKPRPFVGWTENGTDIISTKRTFFRSGITNDLTLTALFQTNLFVDATGGDDANDGFSAAKAKRTLGAISGMAFAGESVAVADGSYDGFSVAVTNVSFASSGGFANAVVTGDVAAADASVSFHGLSFGGGSVSNGTYSGCLFDGAAVADARLTDCTIWGSAEGCYLVRSIVWHGALSARNCIVIDSCLAEPRFVDPENGDFRVAYDSVCVTNGAVWCGVARPFAPRPLPPVISPPDGTVIDGETEVTVSSELPQAKIWYSTTGRTPRQTDAARYTASFTVSTTTVVKAVQRLGCMQSAVATATLTLAPAPSAPWWQSADAVRLEAGEAVEFTTNGSGYVTFEWKCDCEHDPSGGCNYDRLAVYLDGAGVFAKAIDGTTGWTAVKVRPTGRGTHVIRWVYEKDGYDDEELAVEDAGWVRSVAWTASDPIPDLGAAPTAAEIAEALEGSGDARLGTHVRDAASYAGYRAWVLRLEANGIGPETVYGHPRAWPSFALDQSALLSDEIAADDLSVAGFTASGSDGFRLALSLDDVAIGSMATETNLKEFFGLTATTDLSSVPFAADNLVIDAASPQDGDAVFTVRPAGATDAFFLKAEVAQ